MPETTSDRDLRATYLGLRLAMPALVLLLGVAVVAQTVEGCLQPSISAYYFTPVRPVFVAALCAIGACLILYRGAPVENAVLNFSGFLAFVVAFVPTQVGAEACDVTNRPLDEEISAAIGNNVLALYLAGAVALLLGMVVARRFAPTERPTGLWRIVPPVLTTVLVAGFVVFVVALDVFKEWAHLAAAVLLFAGIIAVVIYNAFDAGRSGYRTAYAVLAGLMVVTAAFLFVDVAAKVLVVEAVLIVLFAVYWVIQTVQKSVEESAVTPPPASVPASV